MECKVQTHTLYLWLGDSVTSPFPLLSLVCDWVNTWISMVHEFPWYWQSLVWVITTPLSMVSNQGFHGYDTASFLCDIMLDTIESYPGVHGSLPINMLGLWLRYTIFSTVTRFTACQIFIKLCIGVLYKKLLCTKSFAKITKVKDTLYLWRQINFAHIFYIFQLVQIKFHTDCAHK
jgi:hypothetical protein